jgi:hypothetical protein
MPIVVPGASGAQNNNPDALFIQKVRRILRDQPVVFGESQPTDATTGSLTAGSKPFRLQRAPIWVGPGFVFNLTAPGGPYAVDFDDTGFTPPTGHVNIVSDTGEVIFSTPPAVGTMAVTYQSVRFGETQILDALYEGLQMLWPEIWNPNTDTTSILVSPTQYEYALPAIFQDQRVILMQVEYAPPSGIIRYFKTSLWEQVRDSLNPVIKFSRIPPIASTVRLTYAKPLGTSVLGSVPIEAAHLPTYFALARLLLDQDTMRTRSDDTPAMTGEAAQAPGQAVQTANYWLQQFSTQLTRLGLDEPRRTSVAHRAVERLGLSDIWTDVA